MGKTKKTGLKNILVASAVLCSVGIYIISGLERAETDQDTLSASNKMATDVLPPVATMSTSELVAASAQRVQSSQPDRQVTYPNVTPKKLDKPFSPILEGTDIDGQLKVGEDGELILDLAVKDFFDYFLSATAEVSPEIALDELLRVASESLPPENFQQVQAVLDNYLAYKESALNLMSQPMAPHEQQTPEYQLQVMEETLKQLRALRREHMPESQVEAFFGLEEAYEDYTLATIRIQQNPNLTPEQMHAEMEAQRALLPEVIRNTENRIAEETQTHQEVNELMLSDMDDSELELNLKQKGLPEKAIAEALDFRKQQQMFEQKYAQYQQERDQLRAAGLSKEDMEQQKQRLLEKYFDTEATITQAKVKDLSS